MLRFPGGAPPPGLNRPRFALLMMATLVWDWRYMRMMYWPRWNSPRTVVGGPGLGGKSAWRSPTSNSLRSRLVGFKGVQVPPSSSTPAGFPPRPLLGLPNGGVVAGVNPAAVDAAPGPCASARRP